MSKNSYESGERRILGSEKFSQELRWGWEERWLSKVKDLENSPMEAHYLVSQLEDMSLKGS